MSITLLDFLTTNKGVNVKVLIKDTDLNIIGKIYADSYTSLDETLLSKNIVNWDTIRKNYLIVYLEGEAPPDVPVESVTLSETELTVQVGQSIRISATVLPEDASHPELTWFSTDISIATVEDGVITGHSDGNVSIYAIADEVMSNQCSVTIESLSPIIHVESIMLQETTISLNIGGTTTLVPTILPDDATDKTVIWNSSNEAIATVENGVVTAISEGDAIVTVTSFDGNHSAQCEVLVRQEIIPVENIEINQSALELNIGDSPIQLQVTVLPEDATDKTVVWASSDPSIITVSDEGLVTVVGVGMSNITASSGDIVSEPCVVTVSEQIIQVESVVLSESTLNLELGGESVILTAEVLPIDATDKTVTWASDNESVVTVDDGIVAILGVGQANITASAGDVVSEPCVVTVIEQQVVHVESVTLNESTLNLEVGGEPVTLTATILPENATNKTLSWTSSDESVVSVENGVITIIGEGNASITASADNVISQPCEVTVIQP